MVYKTVKFFKKLSKKEAKRVLKVLNSARKGNLEGFDVKKLKGHKNLFRVRVGSIRIIFEKISSNEYRLVYLGRRGDSDYEKF